MNKEEFDRERTRGVVNPNVIDLISFSEDRDEVTLTITEDRLWTNSPEHIEQIEEKFNSYLNYVMDGHLVKQYPQYSKKRICIKIECRENPHGLTEQLLEAMDQFSKSQGILLVVEASSTDSQ